MRACLSDYELVSAESLPQALDLLSDGWRPIAGGTDLMVLFNAGRLAYKRLAGLQDVSELRRIESDESHVWIGAAATYSEIRQHSLLRSEFPLLTTAAAWTGSVANQNRGTLGGNIANASPAADSSPVLLVYEASLELASACGTRVVPYANFHRGYKQIDLQPDELITRIRLPRGAPVSGGVVRKVGARQAQAISKVSLAAARVGAQIRVAVGSVAPIPLRCTQTEALLHNAAISAELIKEARQTIFHEIAPITDIRSTSEYRARVTANLLGEFLESLL